MRTAARLTICSLLGLAGSMFSAWAIAIWAPNPRANHTASQLRGTSLGLPVRALESLPPPDAYIDRTGVLRQVRLFYRSPEFDVGTMVYVSASGLPLPCLLATNFDVVGVTEAGFVTARSWRSGIPVPALLHPAAPGRVLPLVPIPVPFAVNFAAWSLACVAAHYGWSRTRSRGRRARGQCVECGHPAAGLAVCPECGHTPDSTKPA